MDQLRLNMAQHPLNMDKAKLLRSMAKVRHHLNTAKVRHHLSTAKPRHQQFSMAKDSNTAHPLNTVSTQRDHS